MGGFVGLAAETAKVNAVYDVQLKTLANGVKTDVAGHSLRFDNGKRTVTKLQQWPAPKAIEEVSYKLLEDIVYTIGLYNFHDKNYAAIKSNRTFQGFYGYGQRNVNYWDGTALVQRLVDTYLCMRCGIVLPEALITIDHQKPQAGGELLAVLKVFRALGLTKEGPKGAKGQTLAQFTSHSSHLSFVVWGHPQAIAPHDKVVSGDKSLRQTLSDTGAIVFTALSAFSTDEQTLKTQCMHSLINLKPLCHSCNTSKGNQV